MLRGLSRVVAASLVLCLASLGCLAVQAQGAVKPSDYAAERAKFRTHLLYASSSPQSFDKEVAPKGVSVFTFPSGKLSLKAWVKLPEGVSQNAPVVIFLHGGFAFGAEDFDMAEPFRQAGYAIVAPILRGENGQAGNFSMFYDEVDDVLAIADYVSKQPYADPQRIYLAGHSIGGTHAMLAGMSSARFRAVASFSGSPDQFKWAGSEPWSGVVPFDKSDRREYEMRSPLSWPASFKSPTRLYYGSKEPFFRETTPRLASLANAAGLDVQAKEVPGDHLGAVPGEIAEAITFFKAH